MKVIGLVCMIVDETSAKQILVRDLNRIEGLYNITYIIQLHQ